MSKKTFQPLNIIPPSLSAISHNGDVSSASFTLFQNPKLSYSQSPQIKIKAAPNSSQTQSAPLRIQAQLIPLQQSITGYQICKESFSQEEIIQAFKVIDINKDQYITEEDIIFFLEYIKQPYTKEQVKEMIHMVSSDKKKVTIEDFKKIGKGSIIPFADIKIPDEKTKIKNIIYQNIKNNPVLYGESPEILINASKNQIISTKKFQESNKSNNNNDLLPMKLIDEDQQFSILSQKIPLYSSQIFLQKKQTFKAIQSVNLSQILKNYQNLIVVKKPLQKMSSLYLNHKQISHLLEVTQKQSRLLFQSTKLIHAKRVILEILAFSNVGKMKKLQIGLEFFLKRKIVNVNQVYFLMQVLGGKDQKQKLWKKLLTVLKTKNITKNDNIDKFYVRQIIAANSFNFNF